MQQTRDRFAYNDMYSVAKWISGKYERTKRLERDKNDRVIADDGLLRKKLIEQSRKLLNRPAHAYTSLATSDLPIKCCAHTKL
ncbi:hypothetical protein DPMN_186976 [Dreissena polymorpha]|uniref:Uncharacterized protein n=1 Tax=Dreissena polymorpha TaxID=45954 RepID=A0A9D4DQ40_DREPO|nr:hypothetical protein DPMN_186976 [Dreissena polymorpha]